MIGQLATHHARLIAWSSGKPVKILLAVTVSRRVERKLDLMYTLVRDLKSKETLGQEGLCLGTAFPLAELFYKLHSFTLEAVVFLATRHVLGWATERLVACGGGRSAIGP